MPSKNCEVCGRIVQVPPKEWKYLDRDGPFVCSKDCVFKWMWTSEMPEVVVDGKDVFIRSRSISRKDRVYRSDIEKIFDSAAAWRSLFLDYELYGFSVGDKSLVYIPDFCYTRHCFVEVKGMWMLGARTKVKKFREKFPEFPILVVPWILHKEFK